MNIIGIIPARLKSTRLPNKMLLMAKGKPLIQHVYENALRSKMIKKLFVATDSVKIKNVIEAAGGEAIMTPVTCASGTERIREALKTVKANLNDIVVNIQGDEPLLEPGFIDKAVRALIDSPKLDCATLACHVDEKEASDPSCVKVVTGADSCAVYFSRALIPFSRDGNKQSKASYMKHIGLYAYRKQVLDRWNRMKSRYEGIEKLEQLRMIENGLKIKVIEVKSASIGIDTRADFNKFKKIIRG